MKQIRFWLMVCFGFALLFMPSLACAESKEYPFQERTFIFPKDVKSVGESAFENTAPMAVFFPESLTTIEDRAFAYTKDLFIVCIPKATSYISETAFEGTEHLVIVGISGSYADDWAKAHGYVFIHFDLWVSGAVRRDYAKYLKRYVPAFEKLQGVPKRPLLSFDRNLESLIVNVKEKPETYPIDYDFP